MAALVDYSKFDAIDDVDAPNTPNASSVAPPEALKSRLRWSNNATTAEITLPVPEGTRVGDVQVRFTATRLLVRVRDMGEIALSHPHVEPSACKWEMATRDEAFCAVIQLAKREHELWPRDTFDAAQPATSDAHEDCMRDDRRVVAQPHEGSSSFTWAQEDTTLSIFMGVPATTKASDVRVKTTNAELTVEITMPTGRVGTFARRMWRPIIADESDWELEPLESGKDAKKLRIDLVIATLERWEQPFVS